MAATSRPSSIFGNTIFMLFRDSNIPGPISSQTSGRDNCQKRVIGTEAFDLQWRLVGGRNHRKSGRQRPPDDINIGRRIQRQRIGKIMASPAQVPGEYGRRIRVEYRYERVRFSSVRAEQKTKRIVRGKIMRQGRPAHIGVASSVDSDVPASVVLFSAE